MRLEFVPTITEFGPWAYLEFRPYSILQDSFPPLRDIASLLTDVSVLNMNAHKASHKWLITPEKETKNHSRTLSNASSYWFTLSHRI